MKKKSPRGIPDFGTKGPKSGFLVNKNLPQDTKPVRPNTAPKVKPPATSSKSGRRGG
ncbi:MAG TPA: hypothetical protein VEB19_12605 [Gemmatimonadaceae bacterium]|nr:hypothetical protein [Gemmatimonadaceae bacterium]